MSFTLPRDAELIRRYDLVGLGVSALSQVGDLCAQNHANLKSYETLSDAGGLATVKGCPRCQMTAGAGSAISRVI